MSSRKKSCTACVEAKRRCDLNLPKCQRCFKRDISCTYPWSLSSPHGSCQLKNAPQVWDLVGSKLNTSFQMQQNADFFNVPDWVPSSPGLMTPGMISQIDGLIDQVPISQSSDATDSHAPDAKLQLSLRRNYIQPETIEGPIYEGSIFQERTEYAARRLSEQPRVFAETGQTIFIHRSQVEDSKILQEALAACALHSMRNANNAGLVRSEIARRAGSLVATIHAAAVATIPVKIDLLACLQALVIYQCIRLFSDGTEVRQRAQAETDSRLVRVLAASLRTQLQPFDWTTDWVTWIRAESARRTVLTAELLLACYDFLKFGWDNGHARIASLAFTAQTALWEARSEPEWRTMCLQKPRQEILIQNWETEALTLLPEDVDDLSIIFRALHLGLEPLKEWLGGDRPTLARWGLREWYNG